MDRAPRIAAIQDISGFGRCSMTVILPVLAAMGGQCCPVPTAYLSAHTGFPQTENATFLDMTEQLEGTARHWKELNIDFDAIYSGFVGSERQFELIMQFVDSFRKEGTLVLVDPVMGDHGKVYRSYTKAMCSRMAELSEKADVITPNLTEAALLLGEDYMDAPADGAGLTRWLERLSGDGRRSVVLTGVSFVEGQVGAACLDREEGAVRFAMASREAGQFPGTGDLFASVLLGAMLRGATLVEGTEQAVSFVQQAVRYTLELGTSVPEGVQFEPLLGQLLQIK